MPESQSPLRADAQANHDLLLDSAARAFAEHGTGASLKAIAQDAGVGIGTLYRRFPTRERLVEATYRSEVARICAAVPDLLGSLAPEQALRVWMERFLDFLATKRGMADTLRAVLTTDSSLRLQTRELLTEALSVLLVAGARTGSIRSDVEVEDVLLAIGGVALIAGEDDQRRQAGRLLDLLVAGLVERG